jgi:hypothetical protein
MLRPSFWSHTYTIFDILWKTSEKKKKKTPKDVTKIVYAFAASNVVESNMTIHHPFMRRVGKKKIVNFVVKFVHFGDDNINMDMHCPCDI